MSGRIFGPVPSRRLGRSLGIDPIPRKTCNWNCVYCQLGRTWPLVSERRVYVPTAALLRELDAWVETHGVEGIDWVTLVGSGETTLHSGLRPLISHAKKALRRPLAVITNGSLLHLPEVREDLLEADAVLPSVNAGSELLFRRIHRPRPSEDFEGFLQGLVEFRRVFPGRLWVEVMLLQGLNDTEEALHDLADALGRIDADEVQLTLPERPPVEAWVRPADGEGVMRALAILGRRARVVGPSPVEVDLSSEVDPAGVVADILERHPMTSEQVSELFGRDMSAVLEGLAADGRVQPVERHGLRFWTSSRGRYGGSR